MALTLTDVAAEELKKACTEANFGPEMFVRVGVMGADVPVSNTHCNSTTSLMTKRTLRYEQHGVNFVVDKKSALLLDGCVLGNHKSLERQGFTFENPNAVKSCGCGKSFSNWKSLHQGRAVILQRL